MNRIVKAIATLAILPVSGELLSIRTNRNLQIFVNRKIAEYLYDRGLAKLNSKDYTGAIADFDRVIQSQPELGRIT